MEKHDDAYLLGCAYLREGNYTEALVYLRRQQVVYAQEPSREIPPAFLSNYGLALAMAEGRTSEAVVFCTQAIKKEFYNPDYYLNLAKVYAKANKRGRAVSVLYKGLKIDKSHAGILSALKKLGVRRRPVLPFLSRTNFLNKFFGIVMVWFQNGKLTRVGR